MHVRQHLHIERPAHVVPGKLFDPRRLHPPARTRAPGTGRDETPGFLPRPEHDFAVQPRAIGPLHPDHPRRKGVIQRIPQRDDEPGAGVGRRRG